MNNIMNPEGPVMLFFTKIAYSAYLNVLWFICCLPIITAGASTPKNIIEEVVLNVRDEF